MRGFSVLFVTGLFLAAPVISEAQEPAQEQAPPQIEGVYHCEGMNPDGGPYEGIVEIVKRGDTFRIRWTFEDGQVIGVGIWSNGIFAVSYYGGAPAVVVYKVEGDRLVGEWTMGGMEGQTYSEVLTKVELPAGQPEETQKPPASAPRRPPQPGNQIAL